MGMAIAYGAPLSVSGFARATLYLHERDFVGLERLSQGPGGRPDLGLAKSPVPPEVTAAGELGTFAFITHDRTVAWFQPYAQGRLP
ncbi:hypothetical protein ASD12_24510 [Mesorhizobium sp. Root102]|nr:hypothetical protein ASD12_24510 [Mesorhizobium sp. Root102]